MNQIDIEWIPKASSPSKPTLDDLERALLRALRWVRSSHPASNTRAVITCCSARRGLKHRVYDEVTKEVIPWKISSILPSILAVGVENMAISSPLHTGLGGKKDEGGKLSLSLCVSALHIWALTNTNFFLKAGKASLGLTRKLSACEGAYSIECPISQITWRILWGTWEQNTSCTELRIITEKFKFRKVSCMYRIPDCSPLDILINVIGRWEIWDSLENILMLHRRMIEAKRCLHFINTMTGTPQTVIESSPSWDAMRKLDGNIWEK